MIEDITRKREIEIEGAPLKESAISSNAAPTIKHKDDSYPLF